MTAREWPDSTAPQRLTPEKGCLPVLPRFGPHALLESYVLCKQTSSFPSPKAPGPHLRVAEEMLSVIKAADMHFVIDQ